MMLLDIRTKWYYFLDEEWATMETWKRLTTLGISVDQEGEAFHTVSKKEF